VTKGGFTGKAVSVPGTAIAISKKVLFTPTLVHEMGHCLGLLHTHNSADDDVSTKTFTCEEFVFPSDSDNCIKCGDCICETNAITSSEPFVTEDEDGNCVYGSNAMDSQDDLFEPNEKTLHNFMSYSRNINLGVDCRDRFVDEQINRLKLIILKSGYLDRVRIYDNFNDIPESHDLICLNINNDITIDKNSNFDANTSSNLIGSSEIAVFGDHKIIINENVKVEMDGMNIYNPIDDRWKGIIVRGNGTQDDAFGLETFGGCTIRGAEVGISQNAGSGGGFLSINGTDFQSCDVGIEVMDYTGGDPISITSCNFTDGIFGVTSQNNDITFDFCTFTNMDNAGIRGIGSSITVEGHGGYLTNFTDCKYGIRLSWPNGQIHPTDINNNYFTNNTYDVYVTGGSGVMADQRTNFQSNQSDNSRISIHARGENQLTIRQNTFNNSGFCNYVSNTGGEINFIELNEFSNSNFGDVLTAKNLRTLFNTNCYTNQSIADVYVNGVIPNQGSQVEAPGNCFGGHVQEIRSGGSGESFIYYVPESGVSGAEPCHLVNSTGNYQVLGSETVDEFNGCGVTFPFPSPPPTTTGSSPCNPDRNEQDITQAISDIHALIAEIENNNLLSDETKESLIQYDERCLRKVKLWLVEVLVKNNKRTEALDRLRQDPEFDMQIKGYNLLMHQQDYVNADLYLNNLQTETTEEQAYTFTQNIYLDHISNRTFYPSPSQLATIYQYGIDDNVLSGSIRAIYEYFTDITIELDVTIEGENPTLPRSSKSDEKNNIISIYPNPVSKGQVLSIKFSSPLKSAGFSKAEILDLNGRQIESHKILTQNTDVGISRLSQGVYFIRIFDAEGDVLKTEKLIVI
jgi:NAD-dependent dihydropyrimidine dehydrogenase PreA subunit